MPVPPDPPAPRLAIPDALRRQLDDFRRRLWRAKVLEAIAAGLIGLLVSFLLVFALDRVWQTPGIVRLGILLGGTSLITVFAPFWLHRWVWRHRHANELARLIARRHPGLGDRLLGVIELQGQSGDADSLSPRLREAAMEAVASETARRKLDDALPPQRHRRWAWIAVALVVTAAGFFAVTPRATVNAFQRWLLPLSNTERYTFTRLNAPVKTLAVPFGEAFEVTLRLSADSESRPKSGTGRYGLQPVITSKADGGTYVFAFPGQQDPGTVVFHIGDLRHELRVEPVQRPTAENVTALVTPPAYLGASERKVDLATGVVSAVEGSRIRIEITTNRPLAEGNYGPSQALAPGPDAVGQAMPAPVGGALEIQGVRARTPVLEVAASGVEIPFSWTDTLGLSGDGGFKLRIEGLRDAPPTAYLQGIDRQKVMLPEETLDFEVLAEDDFGVRGAGIEWKGAFTRPSGESPAAGEMKLGQGSADKRRMLEAAAFSPAAFGIAPQKISLRAYSEDFFPERGRVYSEPVTIYVLTRDEHAQLLKSQFDRNITELEDLARRELNQFDENQRLEKLDGAELRQEENAKRLETQEQAEAENTRRMEELTERMEKLMKDAARNGEIDKETLRKMAESLKSMQELSKEDMPKVKEKLGDSQDRANEPQQAEKDVAGAVEEQKKVVEKMQEAISKANDANRRFEAGTFVNRLKKAATEQDSIAGSLIDAYARILGTRLDALDPSDTRRMGEATRQQIETASDVRWIQEDLGHYFARTENDAFKGILDAMRDSRIDTGLEELRARLLANHSYTATESAKKWADKLKEWAATLDGEMKKDQQQGGGGSGGSPDPEDEDFEFMLRVMKMIQQEQDLRSQTRALEQFRRSTGPTS